MKAQESTHVVRKAGFVETSFEHQFHDFMDDDESSDDSDDESPVIKDQKFEFFDGHTAMRLIKAFLFIQILGIIIDNPTIELSVYFRIFCHGILFYSTRFYSRPFLDIIWLVQSFFQVLIDFFSEQEFSIDDDQQSSPIRNRRLNQNPYRTDTSEDTGFFIDMNLIEGKTWHTLQHYSHYFLGLLFVVMAFLFTIRFWEISDYSNRAEIKAWLRKYIANGWWRRGGVSVAISMLQGCLGLGAVLLAISIISTGGSASTLPEPRIIGALVGVGIAVVLVIWVLGYFGIKTTEAAFVRYVSQNVSYTSAIILKRVVKAKIDVGLMLMTALFLPVLYTLLQSLIVVLDWNDTLAPTFRKGFNFFVPCYYLAFPPYRDLNRNSCPVAEFSHPDQFLPAGGFFKDSNILPCDSYLGVTLFVLSAVLFVYILVGYVFFLISNLQRVNQEFKSSRWIDVLEKLMRIKEEEEFDYQQRFSWWQRSYISTRFEIMTQLGHARKGFIWLFITFIRVLKGFIRAIFRPFKIAISPIIFLLERLVTIYCSCCFSPEMSRNISSRGFGMSRRGLSSRDALNKSLRRSLSMRSGSPGKSSRGTTPGTPGFLGRMVSMKDNSGKISFDEDYLKEEKKFENDEFSFSSKIAGYVKNMDVVKNMQNRVKNTKHYLKGCLSRSETYVWCKVQLTLFLHNLFQNKATKDQNYGVAALGLTDLGGSHAPWRKELTLKAKFRLLRRLHHHILAELKSSKIHFVSDHELIVGTLDHTVDSAGFFTFLILYDYNRMYWLLVVFFELFIYVLIGAIGNLYTDWQDRNVYFLVINVIFGFITYFGNPYTEELDRWLEFCGRGLVLVVLIGLILCADLIPDATDSVNTVMYAPWRSLEYIVTIPTRTFGVYQFIDAFMVTYFYCYVLYILYIIGVFGVIDRMIQSFQFGYHDHILDYLSENLDERTYGMENILSGLELVQQWDDIIKVQRRYALLSWPDVRPPRLAPLSVKLFEIKWASLFNLTVGNLRSSLGLSLLHTVMFSADGDSARWLIHNYPFLLKVEDSQKDTPVTIALKECAYFLLVYGEQRGGDLDDGTSYSDEAYGSYYPEVDDMRDEIYLDGEFIKDLCITFYLDAKELDLLRDEAIYREPKNQKKTPPLLLQSTDMVKSGVIGKKKALAEEQMALMMAEKKRKTKARFMAQRAARERESIFKTRFPEDDRHDDYECGQLSSWGVIGFDVPDDNLFMDPLHLKKLKELGSYDYLTENLSHPVAVELPTIEEEKKEEELLPIADIENNLAAVIKKTPAVDETGSTLPVTTTGALTLTNKPIPKDMQYIVRTTRHSHAVKNESLWVPLDHPDVLPLIDWDKKPKKQQRRMSGVSSSGKSTQSGGSSDGPSMSILTGGIRARAQKSDLETRWKICKFADILMSKEIASSCGNMKWKMSDFKAFNKLASATQGRIAQTLAMACHLNPPPGFSRISDWAMGETPTVYDEMPEGDINMVVKGIIAVVSAAERATVAAVDLVQTIRLPKVGLRGRARRMRSTSMGTSVTGSRGATSRRSGGNALKASDLQNSVGKLKERLLSDRVIQFLAEALVCSTDRVDLNDCELSYDGRLGWRAICRALRRKYCSFILPSVFVKPKAIHVVTLILTRNELDCGDAVYLSDVFTHQMSLEYVDLSFNRIGARGMTRMAKAIRNHTSIRTFYVNHNFIGPSCGVDLGVWLKNTKSLKLLSMSHNRLGEIVRFPTPYSREKIPSAVKDIFLGVRANKSLEYLDMSYNHLGPGCATEVPAAVNRHPKLHTLDLSGNDLGPMKGPQLVFLLSGFPTGMKYSAAKEEFIKAVKNRQTQQLRGEGDMLESSIVAPSYAQGGQSMHQSTFHHESSGLPENSYFSENSSLHTTHLFENPHLQQSSSHKDGINPLVLHGSNESLQSSAPISKNIGNIVNKKPCSLTSISLADNQLGSFAGHAVASLIQRCRSLTHLDLSGNALSHKGGDILTDQLELMYGIKPREFLKIVLWEIEEAKYTGRHAKKRKKVFTNLTSLNLSRNGFGPNVAASVFTSLGNSNCSLTNVDLSDNPLGYSVQMGGLALNAGIDIRQGMIESRSLRYLNLSRTQFLPEETVPIFGGLAHNKNILKLNIQDIKLDEPSCLQLANGLEACKTLTHINMARCYMGASGAAMVANKISSLSDRLRYVDLTENYMGPVSAIYIGEALKNPKCTLKTLRLSHNDLMEEGGCFIGKSLIGNISITDIDVSNNFLTYRAAVFFADAARGLFENGKKITDSKIHRFIINNNDQIGAKGAKMLIKSLANDRIKHLEIRNIGARPGTAKLISNSIRDPSIAWQYVDCTGNIFSRVGLNQIFWALRQNKRLRILKCGENQAGTMFCSNNDALLSHGISVPQAIRNNFVLRELDLSFNGLSTDAGINILDAMIDNHTIKKLSLRGNVIDDQVSVLIPDLLRCNNVLEELDLGHNRLGFACAFALAESLEVNRSIRVLYLDYNRFGGAGTATLDAFCRSVTLNFSLKVLIFDGNKLGPLWGKHLAQTFAKNNTLMQVSLRDNRFDAEAGQALLKAYKHSPYMIELGLSADEVGVEVWEQFRLEFEYKRASTSPDALVAETKLSQKQSKLLLDYEM